MLYSVGKDSAVMLHLSDEGVCARQTTVPADARGHHVEVQRDDRLSVTSVIAEARLGSYRA